MATHSESIDQAPSLPPLADDLGSLKSIPLIYLSQQQCLSQKRAATPIEGFEALETHEEPTDDARLLSRQPSISASTTRSQSAPRRARNFFRRLRDRYHLLQATGDRLIRQSRFHGWRMGVLYGCCMSALVLCCNIGLIVAGATSRGGYNSDGIADLFSGDEAKISRYNTVLHVLINVLSTALLAGSNYTMQVLSSPTRHDVDKAHSNGRWLDIGILSPRNLWNIPRKRTALWLILALSSMPLHLFYNASIFKIITSHDFKISTVNVESNDWTRLNKSGDKYWRIDDTASWRDIYSQRYLSANGDLHLAIDRVAFKTFPGVVPTNVSKYVESIKVDTGPGSVVLRNLTAESFDWLRYDYTIPDKNITMPIYLHVAHVFSAKRPDEPSRVQISLYFMAIVVTSNLLKLLVMAMVLLTDRSAYLVTLGDAASSFLERTDMTTTGKCIQGKEEIVISMGRRPLHPLSTAEEVEDLRNRARGTWSPRPRIKFVSFTRQEKVVFSQLILWTLGFVLFGPAISPSEGSWAWGSSSANALSVSSNLPESSTATLINALIANVPQIVLSLGYLTINTICTSMAGAEEWNNLGVSRKALRVTQPRGEQRSTYFLQLPYRWSLPLMISSSTLHWLLSQTLFLVRADFYDSQGRLEPENSISACGFSITSLYVLVAAVIVLLAVVAYMGCQPIQTRAPLVASCSLAISAACHPPIDEKDTHLAKVKWGAVKQATEGTLGHCSLAAGKISEPEVGKTYL